MAGDRFAPRQLSNRGDKLAFSNGIILLALAAALLIAVFHGDTKRLIPLYAVGVFISFTLSQFLVNVRKFAGFMKAVPTVKITGNPCPEDVAELAVRQEVIRNASLEPGVSFKITGISGHKGDYAVSSNRMVRVAVKITGEGYLDYATVLPIVVSNLSMRYEKPEVLFYSNNPERLLKFQQLFNGQLEFDKPSRILYHHQSALASTARFLVDIINPNNE